MKTRNEKIAVIKKLIPDENLRHIIFNFEDDDGCFLSDDKNCLVYFSNIMTFSTILIWNAFLAWKKDICEKNIDGNNSFWRIYNMLDKICDPAKISGEFVDDLLVNLEIDCLLDTDTSTSFVEAIGISNFFKFAQKNNKLSKYIYLVKRRRLSSRNSSVDFNFDTFCECINMFSYLRDSKIYLSSMGIFYDGKEDDRLMKIFLDSSEIYGCEIEHIDFNQSICVYNNMGTYYMEDFSVNDARRFDTAGNKNQSVKLNYVQLGGADRFYVILVNKIDGIDTSEYVITADAAIENFFLNYDIINTYRSKTDGTFFRDYILLNNRYLKELAYTVSDTLSTELKDVIIAKYSPKYKEIFDKMYVASLYNDKEIVGYRWDEIILFLLLEEGVYEFLRVLLRNGGDFRSFISSFQRRFGKDKINNILQNEEFILYPESRLPSGSSENTKIDCRAKALVMLATKLLTQNEWTLEKSIYPTTIDNIIAECDRVYTVTKHSDKEKTIYFCNTVLNIVRFITKFYHGLFQYARNKKQAILDLETSDEYYDSYKRYSRSKEEWIDAMKKAVMAKKSKSLSNNKHNYSLTDKRDFVEKLKKAFNQLIDLNDECSAYHDEQNEILFDVLGRRCLFSSDKMRTYCDEILNVLSTSDICSIERLYSNIKRFLLYIKTGLDDTERKEVRSDFIEMAIYPVVGQYCSGVTSCDGYRYSLFKIASFDNTENAISINIKMISDDEFDFGYSYYCIPNINRIANVKQEYHYDKIWVSPIIIPCSVYLPQSISQLDILSNEQDFESATELIYNSDLFVYENLFGSLENAKLILPSLLKNPKSKFYKDHYRVVRKDKRIVAIAAVYNFIDFSWDSDDVLKAFGDAGIETPPTFEVAINNLKETFNDCLGKMYYQIDDVCVHEDYRRHGIGRSLIMHLIKMAEKSNVSVRLSVYSENLIAYNLYCSLGFVPITSQTAAENDMYKGYIQMVKI